MDLAKTTARRHEKHLCFITIPSNGRLMLTSNELRNTSSQTYIFPILTCYWHQFISTFLQSLLRKFQGMVVPYSSILVTSLRFSKVAFNNWNMQVIALHRKIIMHLRIKFEICPEYFRSIAFTDMERFIDIQSHRASPDTTGYSMSYKNE